MATWPPLVHQDVQDEVTRIAAAILAQTSTINTSESVSSSAYTDLATVGPSISGITVSPSGTLLVIVTALMTPGSTSDTTLCAVALTGRAAADSEAVRATGVSIRGTAVTRITGLTPGAVVTATMKYRSTLATSCTYDQRSLTVIPL